MDQLAVARETFMFEARIGRVGPVILCLALFKFCMLCNSLNYCVEIKILYFIKYITLHIDYYE